MTILTRAEKAAATRRKNKAEAEAVRLKAMHSDRARRSWETRRINAIATGKIDADGQPTLKETKKRRRIALKAWRTRRNRQVESGMQAQASA